MSFSLTHIPEDLPVDYVEKYTLPASFDRQKNSRDAVSWWPATLFGGGYEVKIKEGPRLWFFIRVINEKVTFRMYPIGPSIKWKFPSLCLKFLCPSSVISLPICIHDRNDEKEEEDWIDLETASSRLLVLLATAGGDMYRISLPLTHWASLDSPNRSALSSLDVHVDGHHELRSTHALPLTSFTAASSDLWIAGSSVGSLFVIQPDRGSHRDGVFGQFDELELRDTNFLKKLLLDWIPGRGFRTGISLHTAGFTWVAIVNVAFKLMEDDVYVLALHADQKLKIWSLRHASCLQTISILEPQISNNNSSAHLLPLHRKYLQLVDDIEKRERPSDDSSQSDDSLFLSFLVFSSMTNPVFKVFTLLLNDSHSQIQDYLVLMERGCPFSGDELIDFNLLCGKLYSLWETSSSPSISPLSRFLVRTIELLTASGAPSTATRWNTIEHPLSHSGFSIDHLPEYLVQSNYLTSIEEICWNYFHRSTSTITPMILVKALAWYEKFSPIDDNAGFQSPREIDKTDLSYPSPHFKRKELFFSDAPMATLNDLKRRLRMAIHDQVVRQSFADGTPIPASFSSTDHYSKTTRLEWFRIVSFCNQLSRLNSMSLGFFLSQFHSPISDAYEMFGTYGPNLVVITRKGLSLDRPSGIEEYFANFVLGARDFTEMTLFCKSLPISSFFRIHFPTYPPIGRILLKFAKLRSTSALLVSDEWSDMVDRIFMKHVALGPSFMPLDVWEELRDLSSEALLRLPSAQKQLLCEAIKEQEIMEIMEFLLTLHHDHESERERFSSSPISRPMTRSNLWDFYFHSVSDLLSSIWNLYVILLKIACMIMPIEFGNDGQNARILPMGLVANFIQHMRHFWILLKLTDKTLLGIQSNSFFDPSVLSPQRSSMEAETDMTFILENPSMHPTGRVSFEFPLKSLLVQQILDQMLLSKFEKSSFLISPYSILYGLLRKFHTEDGEAELLVRTALSIYRQGDPYQTHQILSYASYRSAGVSHLLCKTDLRLGRMDQAVENGLLTIRFFSMLIISLSGRMKTMAFP